MPFIACKLPAGLRIDHEGKTLTLVGSNIGEDLGTVSRNGMPGDNEFRVSGFGLSEVSAEQAETFQKWSDAVTYNEGDKNKGKLTHPFPALENGSILGPFKTIDEARKECKAIADSVKTGFEGLDEEEEERKNNITRADNKK